MLYVLIIVVIDTKVMNFIYFCRQIEEKNEKYMEIVSRLSLLDTVYRRDMDTVYHPHSRDAAV